MSKLVVGTEEVLKVMMGTEEVTSLFMGDEEIPSSGSPTVNYVDYIHSSSMQNGSHDILATSIYPTLGTKIRTKGKFMGYYTAEFVVGTMNSNDSRDFRWFFFTNSSTFMLDLSSGRLDFGANNLGLNFSSGNTFDITCSNLAVVNNNTQQTITGSTQSGTIDNNPFGINVGSVWIAEVQIMDEYDTVLFDGKAAEVNGEYGLWDEISHTFLTDPNYNIVGENEQV